MAKRKEVHTVPNGQGKWKNVQGGETISNHRKKETAVEAGKKEAKKQEAEHVIHKKDGTIQNSNSYGYDSNPPKDMP